MTLWRRRLCTLEMMRLLTMMILVVGLQESYKVMQWGECDRLMCFSLFEAPLKIISFLKELANDVLFFRYEFLCISCTLHEMHGASKLNGTGTVCSCLQKDDAQNKQHY